MPLFGGRAGMAALVGIKAGGAAGAAWKGLNPLARSSLTGAGIGAAYGAFSDNTSVLGGAAMGAMGGFAYPTLRAGAQGLWKGSMGGAGWLGSFSRAGRNMADQLAWDGAKASRYIGRTARRAYNNFSALGKNIKVGWRG